MSTRRNLVAGALGSGWSALVQLAFVPVYVAILGVEAYGLIAFYAVLQVSLWVLDMGFTPAVSREVSRALAGASQIDRVRALMRSIEWTFAVAALALVAAGLVLAPWFAAHWLKAEALPQASAERAVAIMGALLALRLFVGLHRGAITGAQRLVWLNGVGAAFATLRGVGVIPVLWAAPTIEAFFVFQLGSTILEALVMAAMAWRLLPSPRPAAASLAALRAVRHFSGGMVLVTILFVVLTQSDKLLLSTLLPLASFGHYALAASVAAALNLLVAPVGTVAYPRLNELLAGGGPAAAALGGFAQLVTLAVAPAAVVVALFAEPLLLLWTRDAGVSAAAAPLLAWLAIGSMLHAFTTVPYLVPIVQGTPRVLVGVYAVLVGLFLPALGVAAASHGAMGAARAWVVVSVAGVAFCWPLMRRLMQRSECIQWLTRDVVAPTVAATAAALAVRALVEPSGDLAAAAAIAAAYVAALSAAAFTLPSGLGVVARVLRARAGGD